LDLPDYIDWDLVLAFLSRSRYPLDYLSIEIQQYGNDEDELPRILAAILSVSTLKMVCWPQSVALLLEYLSSSPLVPRLEHLTVESLGSANYDLLVEMLHCRRNPELGAKLRSLRLIVTNWEDLPKVPKWPPGRLNMIIGLRSPKAQCFSFRKRTPLILLSGVGVNLEDRFRKFGSPNNARQISGQ
jgi:hypothetical protein